MAEQGRKLDESTRRQIVRLSQVQSIRQTAKLAEVSRNTARKYIRGQKDDRDTD